METIVLCWLGGGLGIGFSFVFAKITETFIRSLLPYAPTAGLVVISAELAILTLTLVIGVGIVSGLYPGWRAARVRPLESIWSGGE